MTPEPELKSLKTLTVKDGDALIHISRLGKIDIYAEIGDTVIQAPALTALGLYWSLQNGDWRYKITRRAREKVLEMMEKKK